MTDEEYQIRRKYENRNLMQELEWVSHYPPSRMSNQDKAFIRWLAMTAYDKINELEQTSVPVHDMELILHEVAKPQWIPVTERLPKINSDMYSDDLIVCMRRFDGEDYYYEKFAGYLTSGNIWYTYQHDSCSQVGIEHHMKHCRGTADVIVAWMPMPSLPEPPKEET